MRKTIRGRHYTDVYNFPDDEEDKVSFLKYLLDDYTYILLSGVAGTGKSETIKYYNGKLDWTYSLWNREKIFRMLFVDGERDESFNGKIQNFEADIFTKLFEMSHHQVIVDSWNRMPSTRTRYLSYLPENSGRSCILVFDGPFEQIFKRVDKNKYNMFNEDIKIWLKRKHDTMTFPTAKEGFDSIYYINTFGQEGVEYLKERLTRKLG